MTNKEPSLKVRFILYPVIAGLFLLGCILISLLAMGYNLKIENGRIIKEKTGTIILATRPGDAQVFLDGKLYEKSTPLFNFFNLNIDRLTVGQHSIKIQKEGYETWDGSFNVRSGLVSWGNYILLLPRERNYSEYSFNGLKQIVASEDGTREAILTEDWENGLVFIHELNTQSKNTERIYEARLVAGDSYNLEYYSEDEGRLYFKKKSAKGATAYAVESSTKGRLYPLFGGLKPDYTVEGFNPRDNEEFLIRYGKALYLYNYVTGKLGGLVADNVVSVSHSGAETFFVKKTNDGFSLWRLAQEPIELVKKLPTAEGYQITYVTRIRSYAVRTNTGELYLVERNHDNNYKKLADGVTTIKESSNEKYLYYQSGDALYAYEVDKGEVFTTIRDKKINSFVVAEDESNVFVSEGSNLKLVNYNGLYETKIADVKEFPIMISNNYNLYFVSERADKKADLKVFSFNL